MWGRNNKYSSIKTIPAESQVAAGGKLSGDWARVAVIDGELFQADDLDADPLVILRHAGACCVRLRKPPQDGRRKNRGWPNADNAEISRRFRRTSIATSRWGGAQAQRWLLKLWIKHRERLAP
jgi:hypothetical protein